MTRVLVVDDAADARKLLAAVLSRHGFVVDEAADGESALAAVAGNRPDLVLLDVNMPGMSGLEVMNELRQRHGVPVILVTARDEEDDRVVGLELGAQDYVVKPFYANELVARVRAVLRRVRPPQASLADRRQVQLQFGPLVIHLGERKVSVHGVPVELTAKEFDLLAFLACSPRAVFTRATLLEHVWGSSTEWQDPATVTEHVRRLRAKIEADAERPAWLRTVRGIGYRFDPPP